MDDSTDAPKPNEDAQVLAVLVTVCDAMRTLGRRGRLKVLKAAAILTLGEP